MMEFCNFENCGLSFALFNKLVWAPIMENGCRGRGSERERARGRSRERERLDSLWNHFPFFKYVLAIFFRFWDVSHYHVGAAVGKQILDGEDREENCR